MILSLSKVAQSRGEIVPDKVQLICEAMQSSKLGEIIRKNYLLLLERLDKEGVTQEQVARKIGFSASLISQMKHGRKPIEVDTLEALCKAYDVPPIWFLQDTEQDWRRVVLKDSRLTAAQNEQLFNDLIRIRAGLISEYLKQHHNGA